MPSACFQGVYTFWIASNHAEGMSLRYDAIFTLWWDFYKPVHNIFSTFSVIWEIIKPYKVFRDLIVESNDAINAYEMKWGKQNPNVPGGFAKAYPNAIYNVVNPENHFTLL